MIRVVLFFVVVTALVVAGMRALPHVQLKKVTRFLGWALAAMAGACIALLLFQLLNILSTLTN